MINALQEGNHQNFIDFIKGQFNLKDSKSDLKQNNLPILTRIPKPQNKFDSKPNKDFQVLDRLVKIKEQSQF